MQLPRILYLAEPLILAPAYSEHVQVYQNKPTKHALKQEAPQHLGSGGRKTSAQTLLCHFRLSHFG